MALEERLAIITGATGELGSRVTQTLASLGVNLALLDRESDRLAASLPAWISLDPAS